MIMNNFNMSPQLLQAIKGGNPQQVAMNLLSSKANGNPILENLLELANKGDGASVEKICKNMIKSKGYDPDELMKDFKNQFG